MQDWKETYNKQLILRRYSQNTVNIYTKCFSDFLNYFENSAIENLRENEINDYLLSLVQEKEISTSQQNQRVNAIKFFYEKVLNQGKRYFEIYRPMPEKKLPKVISKDEVKQIFKSCNNLKHNSILMLIYSAGLRRSELLNLELSDIDSNRMLILIRGGKGKKDRFSLLSNNLLEILREYFKEFRPQKYLFESPQGECILQAVLQKFYFVLQKKQELKNV